MRLIEELRPDVALLDCRLPERIAVTHEAEKTKQEVTMTIRVLLADDHPAVRAGIRGALERAADMEVVGEAGDGEEALRLIEELRPDVALLDCRLPGREGAEVAAALREQGLPTRVLALSAYKEDKYVYGMLQAGAMGYLLKDEPLETVVAAVRAVAGGEQWYSQPVLAKVTAWACGEVKEGVCPLTERELDVLRLLAQGYTNMRIAKELSIVERTVGFHVSNILKKLEVTSRVEAAMWAKEHGIVS
ncbi:MAG: response regulator transcription factor [Chloroflexota bacterium]|nr:response regulator transcription factor [Chloroflexota bacterium]